MSDSEIVRTVASAGSFRSWGATHRGVSRARNEDGFVNRPDRGLWAVADGAGGHQAGEVASQRVVDALESLAADLPPFALLAAVKSCLDAAHESLRAEGARRGAGAVVATTVVVLLAADDHYCCLWAGDSRAYLLRAGAMVQLSRDHSLVQEMVESGAIDAADADGHPHANVITRAVGTDTDHVGLEQRSGALQPGDRVLLCSDGLCKTLSDATIAALLGADEDAPAERLVLAALAAGVSDNVTAVALEVVADPP